MRLLKLTTEKGFIQVVSIEKIIGLSRTYTGRASIWVFGDYNVVTQDSFEYVEKRLSELGIEIIEL